MAADPYRARLHRFSVDLDPLFGEVSEGGLAVRDIPVLADLLLDLLRGGFRILLTTESAFVFLQAPSGFRISTDFHPIRERPVLLFENLHEKSASFGCA